MSWWWNDRGHVGSGRGSHAPVDCAQLRPSHRWEWVPWLGPHGSSSCQRSTEGVGHFDDVMGARARWEMPPEASISPETFPQGSGGMEVDFHALSD
jgi:hypothetical protein